MSVVHGRLSEERAAAVSSRGRAAAAPGQPYSAAALSLVFHPRNPFVPTLRGDVRYFEVCSSPNRVPRRSLSSAGMSHACRQQRLGGLILLLCGDAAETLSAIRCWPFALTLAVLSASTWALFDRSRLKTKMGGERAGLEAVPT